MKGYSLWIKENRCFSNNNITFKLQLIPITNYNAEKTIVEHTALTFSTQM